MNNLKKYLNKYKIKFTYKTDSNSRGIIYKEQIIIYFYNLKKLSCIKGEYCYNDKNSYEIALMDKDNKFIWEDDIKGYQTIKDIIEVIKENSIPVLKKFLKEKRK